MAKAGDTEKKILQFFKRDATFELNNIKYVVTSAGKPKPLIGECKTDIYVAAYQQNNLNNIIELKISIKQENADFVENKMQFERAAQIWKDNTEEKVKELILKVSGKFKTFIYLDKFKRTGAGAITLGWKFELINKGTIETSAELSPEQKLECYSGKSLSDGKVNSRINKQVVNNSGIANYYLICNDYILSIQDVINNLIEINIENIDKLPDLFVACKALNYLIFKNKHDGDRPLGLHVKWQIEDGKLKADLSFENPLKTKGNEIANSLKYLLNQLNINASNFHLIRSKIHDQTIIHPPVL